jgi:hypothetical protein
LADGVKRGYFKGIDTQKKNVHHSWISRCVIITIRYAGNAVKCAFGVKKGVFWVGVKIKSIQVLHHIVQGVQYVHNI